MGHGSFDTTSSAARASVRASTGVDAFAHTRAVRAGTAAPLHDTLDLTKKPRRECRDNEDNPEAVPIAVMVDVTGSMGATAGLIIDSLNKAVSVIQGKGAVPHPAILFGAIGDATCDTTPIQVGEFESSDELAENHLANIYKEGGGGGQTMESYELAMWFFANQVDTDHWEKRGSKGFLFLIGDESPYPRVKAHEVLKHCGTTLEEDIALKTIADKLQERWHVFVLRPGGTSYDHDPNIRQVWTNVLPVERVIDVDDWHEITSMIAGTVSVMSGLSLDDTIAAMSSVGLRTNGTSTALATIADSASLVTASSTDLADADTAGAVRV